MEVQVLSDPLNFFEKDLSMNLEAPPDELWDLKLKCVLMAQTTKGYSVTVWTLKQVTKNCNTCGKNADYALFLKTHSPTTHNYAFCKPDLNKYLASHGVNNMIP